MVNPTIHFIGGLPRSGSTLLCNLLAQNPRFYSTSTSGIINIMIQVRNAWDDVDSFRATPNTRGKELVLKSILTGYYSECPRPVAFDKSRGWLSYVEMLEHILERRVKVLVPVRDLRAVVASFERIYRENAAINPLPQERHNPIQWQTMQGRITMFTNDSGPIGSAYNRIKDAMHRGLLDRMHFIKYESLVDDPVGTMNAVYDFLEEDRFIHDFNNIDQVTHEDDTGFGFPAGSLHTIRSKLGPPTTKWEDILTPEIANSVAPSNALWDNL